MTLTQLFKNIADAIRNKKGTTGTIKATNFADEISSITLATGDAIEGDVLSGKTFSKTGANGLTGSMTNNGAWGSTISAGGSATIPAGYHNGSGKVSATANSGNATTAQVLSGATFYSSSATKQTGAMANRGAWGSTINPGGSVTIPAGYHNGSGVVSANNSLISSATLLFNAGNGEGPATSYTVPSFYKTLLVFGARGELTISGSIGGKISIAATNAGGGFQNGSYLLYNVPAGTILTNPSFNPSYTNGGLVVWALNY